MARGFALGFVVNFFPTFGFGVVISGIVARTLGGNTVAGFIGGALLTFFWPILFYANLRMGAWLRDMRSPVEDPDDLTEKVISTLAWGKTFTVGAFVNSLLVGLTVYLLLRLVYERVRPRTLAYLRAHAREHQRRFSLHHQLTGPTAAVRKSTSRVINPP